MPCGDLRSQPLPTLTSSSTRKKERKKESSPPFSQPFPYFICISLTRSQTACSRPFPLAKQASLSFRSRLKTREMEAYATPSSVQTDIVFQASKSPRRRPLFPFPSTGFYCLSTNFCSRTFDIFIYVSTRYSFSIFSFYYSAVSFTCIYFLRIPASSIHSAVRQTRGKRSWTKSVSSTSYSRAVNCILLKEKLRFVPSFKFR